MSSIPDASPLSIAGTSGAENLCRLRRSVELFGNRAILFLCSIQNEIAVFCFE